MWHSTLDRIPTWKLNYSYDCPISLLQPGQMRDDAPTLTHTLSQTNIRWEGAFEVIYLHKTWTNTVQNCTPADTGYALKNKERCGSNIWQVSPCTSHALQFYWENISWIISKVTGKLIEPNAITASFDLTIHTISLSSLEVAFVAFVTLLTKWLILLKGKSTAPPHIHCG